VQVLDWRLAELGLGLGRDAHAISNVGREPEAVTARGGESEISPGAHAFTSRASAECASASLREQRGVVVLPLSAVRVVLRLVLAGAERGLDELRCRCVCFPKPHDSHGTKPR
jgi:hypothetical protein